MICMIPTNEQLIFMITILNRGNCERLAKVCEEEGVLFHISSFGIGTANSEILDFFGLGETEKTVFYSLMSQSVAKLMMNRLVYEFGLKEPGSGIAFTMPVSSVVGMTEPGSPTCKPTKMEGESKMDQTYQHELVIAVVNRGYAGEVMDAARSVQATGGTVVHARGADLKQTEKFFGITIQPEKELILILAEKESKQKIMRAIAQKSASQTNCKLFVFSVPVTEVIGMSSIFCEKK